MGRRHSAIMWRRVQFLGVEGTQSFQHFSTEAFMTHGVLSGIRCPAFLRGQRPAVTPPCARFFFPAGVAFGCMARQGCTYQLSEALLHEELGTLSTRHPAPDPWEN